MRTVTVIVCLILVVFPNLVGKYNNICNTVVQKGFFSLKYVPYTLFLLVLMLSKTSTHFFKNNKSSIDTSVYKFKIVTEIKNQ